MISRSSSRVDRSMHNTRNVKSEDNEDVKMTDDQSNSISEHITTIPNQTNPAGYCTTKAPKVRGVYKSSLYSSPFAPSSMTAFQDNANNSPGIAFLPIVMASGIYQPVAVDDDALLS